MCSPDTGSSPCAKVEIGMNKSNYLKNTILKFKSAFIFVGFFSLIINVLLLVSPLYMLQIYDRVLSSGSQETLIALTGIAIFLLIVLGMLEVVRSRVLIRVGTDLDEITKGKVFEGLFEAGLRRGVTSNSQGIRDLETVRQFLSSNALFVFYDAPWVPFFIGLIFVLHPLLGTISLVGALVIFSLAMATEFFSRGIFKEAAGHAVRSSTFAEASLRNSDVLQAMGMLPQVNQRWQAIHNPMVNLQSKANARVGILVGASKVVRFSLQVFILGAGAWLVLQQDSTPGVMIAASIIMGRALAPVEQAIGTWRSFVGARTAYQRLEELLAHQDSTREVVNLPRPEGRLLVNHLFASPPNYQKPVLKDINFVLEPGQALGVIGPSAAGKTTLARLLVGVWPPLQGHVRLDGADIYSWDSASRGPYLGYLPQDVELFSGTIAENIGRFEELDSDAVIAAANLAGCHELILQLPQGYETRIGEGGSCLSGGQRQRIALARAVFRAPAFIVLDEPDSNLDSSGEAALVETITRLKAQETTVVLIAHNTRLLQVVDKILLLNDGQVGVFGAKDEVLGQLARQSQKKAV